MLEQSIQEMNNTMRELIVVLNRMYADEVAIDAQAYREAKAIEADPAEPAKAEVTETPADTEVATEYTMDQVKATVVKLVKTKGRETAVDLLARFKVDKAPDLSPAQFSRFVADAQVLMEA